MFDFIKKIIDSLKSLFRIHSPSEELAQYKIVLKDTGKGE